MKISICLCIRDCEDYLMYIDELFNRIEKLYDTYEFEYFLYENNSTDNTKDLVKYFLKNRNGKYLIEDL